MGTYDAPALVTLYNRITADIQSAMYKSPALLVRVMRLAGGAALGGVSWGMHKAIEFAAAQGLPSTAIDEGLDGWGQVGNRDRNEPSYWTGTVNVYAAGLSVVATGARMTLRGTSQLYEVTTGHTWGAVTGYYALPVRALVAGTAYNLEAGDVLQFVTPPVGVSSGAFVSTVTAAAMDTEDNDDYRPDVIAGVQGAGARGGNVVDWPFWAGQVPGVLSSVATSPAPGYVTITVAASDGAVPPAEAVPSAGLLSDVTDALDLVAPVDVRVTVAAWSA